MSVKQSVQRWLIENHWRLRPFIPDRYFAFRSRQGRIYWNLKQCPGMFRRAFGIYEREKMDAIRALLKPGSTFIDVGGNTGDFSLLAADIVGKSGKVVCIEPEPTNCFWIKKSVALNSYANIVVQELALADSDGDAELFLGSRCDFHTLLKDQPERQSGVIRVRTRTLDRLVQELGCENVGMIKIDVEGAELQALKGARRTLEKNSDVTLLMEIHPLMGIDPFEVCNFLRELGFSLFQMCPPYNVPLRIDDHVSEVLARRC